MKRVKRGITWKYDGVVAIFIFYISLMKGRTLSHGSARSLRVFPLLHAFRRRARERETASTNERREQKVRICGAKYARNRGLTHRDCCRCLSAGIPACGCDVDCRAACRLWAPRFPAAARDVVWGTPDRKCDRARPRPIPASIPPPNSPGSIPGIPSIGPGWKFKRTGEHR